jgi:hypothetical protein
MSLQQITSRYQPIEPPLTCHLRITGKTGTYDRMRDYTIDHGRKVISRLRRMGKTVEVTWFEGMGLGIE